MIISLYARPFEKLRIEPDPAIVHLGDRVAWRLFFDSQQRIFRPILWKIYFQGNHPFGNHYPRQWLLHTEPDQEGIVEAGTAEEPGDFKYGVRIVKADTREEISDDDPRVIVVK